VDLDAAMEDLQHRVDDRWRDGGRVDDSIARLGETARAHMLTERTP
jgi:hypothetical protein